MRRASSAMRGWEKNGAFRSVRKNPGAIALAVTPFSPSSTASARISASSPTLWPHHRADEHEPPLASRRHVPRGHAGELVLRHQVGLDQAAEVLGRDVLQGPA